MFWYDGSLHQEDTLTLSIRDPALLYGATVFTTLRIYQQSLKHPLTQWSAHCHRLSKAIESFNWPSPNWDNLEKGTQILAQNYTVLRVVLFPDGREWITGRPIPEDYRKIQQEGIAGWVATDSLYTRSLTDYKTGNYLAAWLALQKAQSQGKREAILVNSQGNWLETATGNLWGWKDGLWYTPPLTEGILPGISRGYLIDCLSRLRVPPQEVIWTLEFVKSLEIIAYSNSVVEVVPFQSIEIDKQTLQFNSPYRACQLLQAFYKLA